MTNDSTPALVAAVNQRFFYGWLMLAIAFVAMFASGAGQSFTISIFVSPIIEALDISRTTISSAYTLGTLTAAMGLTYVGRLVDRFGVRTMLVGVVLLLGSSAILFSAVSNIVALYAVFTAVRIFGQGALMLISTNLVSQWFVRRRGFALSVCNLGFAVSSAVYPPVIQLFIRLSDWRTTWIWLGLFTWAIVIPVALVFVRTRPEQVGLTPDGAGRQPEADSGGSQAPKAGEEEGWTVSEALHTAQFWIVALANAVPSMLITGMVFHQISYFHEQGLSDQAAANVFTVTAVAMVAFGLCMGYMLDRFQTRYMMTLSLGLIAAAMYVMLIASTPMLAALYGVVFGMASGSMMMMTTYVWPRYFGRKHLGGIQGVAVTITIMGASLGPLPFGLAFDLLGGYREALLLLSVLPLASAAVVFFTRPPVRANPPTPTGAQ